MSSKIRSDQLSAVVIFLLAAFIFIYTTGIRDSSLSTMQMGPGTGAFPKFLAIILAIFSVALFVTAGLKGRSLENAPKEAEKAGIVSSAIEESFSARIYRIALFVAALCVYFVIMQYAGFLAGTTLFGVIFLKLILKQDFTKSLIHAIAISIFCYLIFEIGLGVPLPAFFGR